MFIKNSYTVTSIFQISRFCEILTNIEHNILLGSQVPCRGPLGIRELLFGSRYFKESSENVQVKQLLYTYPVSSTSLSDLRINSEFVSVLDETKAQNVTRQTVCHCVNTNNSYGYINTLLDYVSVVYNYHYSKMLVTYNCQCL